GWAMVALGAGGWAALRPATRRAGWLLAASAAVLATIFSAVAPGPGPAAGSTIRVAAIQPGTSLEEKWDPSQGPRIARQVWQMTRKAAAGGAQLVLWPESAVPYSFEKDAEYRRIVEGLAAELNIHILLNSIGTTPAGGFTNSAYSVGPGGIEPGRYDKVRLVPFGEYVPFIGRFAFAESLVREVGQFTPGRDPEPLRVGRNRVGMAICYEVVFPSLIAREVRRGASFLVTLTNDGWYGYSWAPHQHFAQVILRAAETRRWFARAALTGISGFIDPRGHVVRKLAVGRTGILFGDITPLSAETPRVRLGNWWVWICALGMLVLLRPALVRRHRNGRSPAGG
ncbi:MAG: apolipoprotein N-acyltransferase, partial [Acidobacteria bacterium]|nr:apolipoprotein N-acyltransferase [Acidobacteriota bacterium]